MKDPSKNLREAYWIALSNYNRYDSLAPNGVPKPYIIINVSDIDQDPYKQSIVYSDVKVSLDIVSNYNGFAEVDRISQEVIDIVYSNGKTSFELPDFHIMGLKISVQSIPIIETPTGAISRKIISFYHNLRQK
jgi:hypothetical protein